MANILIIEDQEQLCNLYSSVLTRFDHQIALATSGDVGIEMAIRDRPDLIILDLLLPGVPGIEVASRLREAGVFPDTPLIITTALDEADAFAIAKTLGATAVLNKPFTINSILDSVNLALGSKDGASSPHEPSGTERTLRQGAGPR